MSIVNNSYIESHNICLKHKRPREICCIQCKEVICTKCALFDHRNHPFREVEAVGAENAENVQEILQLQQKLESTKAKIDARSWEPIVREKY